jgi:excisionase family DNA binding protein
MNGRTADHHRTTPQPGKGAHQAAQPARHTEGEHPMPAVRVRNCVPTAPALPEGLLTIDEAAALIKMSPRYVRRLVTERRIVFYRLGRAVRFAPTDLTAFVQAGRVEPMTPETVWNGLRRVA